MEPGGISHTLLTDHAAAEIVPAGDAPAILAAVRRVAADGRRADELVEAGTRMGAELWSADGASARYRRFVSRLLNG